MPLEEIDAAVYRITISFLGSYSDLLELVDGFEFTVLGPFFLVPAISGIFLFKLITVRRPSEIEGVGSLNEPNIMKAELHERVGQLKAQGLSPTGP
ncbi:putative quinate permease [Fusarium oxysporum f. sp. albedinis]|nr:putative quinate permease [Fusarium oxysporum f. sp. albedinis]